MNKKMITYTYSVLAVKFYVFTPCDVTDFAQTDSDIFGVLLSLVTIIFFSLYVLMLCTCAAAP